MTPGEIIRQCRKKKGLSIRELERLSGVSAPQISNIEHGKNEPYLRTYQILLDAMGYDLVIKDRCRTGK